MKRCLLLVLTVVIFPASVFAQATREYIVVTRQQGHAALQALRNDDWSPRAGMESVREFKYVPGFTVELTDEEVAQLKKSRTVRWVEPVLERHALSDTITAGTQIAPYGVNMVHAPDVWPVTKGKAVDGKTPIRVAVIDTGVRYNTPELKGAYKGGYDFIARTADPYDDEGHGTHVAGTIAAADDGAGVVGIAPQVELYALKVLNACGSGSTTNIIQAIEWVISKKTEIGGNWIINMSLGSQQPSDAEQLAVQHASDAGVLVFAAAGNDYDTYPDTLSYPAAYSTVVSVGAIDSTKAIASFSQRGTDLKVVAPGVDVLSTFIGGHVTTGDGRRYVGALASAANSKGDPVCLTSPTVAAVPYVYCGFGAAGDFPASVRGKIALVQRGPIGDSAIKFVDKVKNAKTAGAVGVVLFDHTDEMVFGPGFTIQSASEVLPTIMVTKADGAALQTTPDATLSVGVSTDDYLFALLGGTSMACPHAVGVAALAWAVAPTATATAIANAMMMTATDLGTAGFDTTFGNGLVNAANAAKQLNPAAFGSGATPTGGKVTGRAPGRRGH